MAYFTKADPITAAVAARDKLRNRLAESEAAIVTATENAKALAFKGADDAALDVAESQVRSRIDRVTTLRAVLIQSDELIVSLTAERDAAADKATRHATADEIEQMLRTGVATAKRFDAVMTEMAEFSAWATFIPEAAGLQNFCKAARAQIPDAFAMLSKLAGHHAQAVLAGTVAPTLKKQEIPFVPIVAALPPTVQLFCMRPVKWRDANGKQVVAQKFSDAELTPQAAKRALSEKACVQMNDSLRRQHHGTTPGHADPRLALDLDADPASIPQTAPIQHSAFEPAVVGPARILKIAREG